VTPARRRRVAQTAGASVAAVPLVDAPAAPRPPVDSLLHSVIDGFDEHVALISEAGDIVAVNRAWTEFAVANGYRDGGTGVGTNYFTCCIGAIGADTEGAADAERGIRRVLAGELPTFELDYPCHAPWTERWFRMRVQRVTRDGAVAALIRHTNTTPAQLASRDVAGAEARFRRLSDATTDGVVVSRNTIILEVNAAYCRMFGATESTLIGTSVLSLVAPVDQETARQRVHANRPDAYSVTLKRHDGTTFDADVTGRPIWHANGEARISVIRDVTELRRVERLKNEFVSTVSHELRTPLTAIHGSVRLLEGGAAGPLGQKAVALLAIARSNSERLIRLVNDLLDIDKMAAGQLQLQRTVVRLTDLVRGACDGIRSVAELAGISVEHDGEDAGTLSADRDRLVQVVTNLLSNAVKFAPPGSAVVVRTPAVGTGWVRITVSNTGPGIASEDLPRLFERFHQLDASDSRSRGGTGLGLAISKSIVEQHGGRIGVRSEPGVRTTFWVELPRADIADRPDAEAAPGSGAAHGRSAGDGPPPG